MKITETASAMVKTMVYVIRGVSVYLLERTDAMNLGIIEFHLGCSDTEKGSQNPEETSSYSGRGGLGWSNTVD